MCFTGHRRLTAAEEASVGLRLDHVLAKLYQQGYRFFIAGGALGFDTLAAEAVIRLREYNNDVRLIVAVPCKSQASKWNPEEKARYDAILEQADETILLSRKYYTGCMHVRNRFMVNHASFVVCYLNSFSGGTFSTVTYALKNDKKVLNIAIDSECLGFCDTAS
ncbi:MAG: SLOG family protein [Clostridia bacterium]|nr:SLOG family protein [Clostridia bacterium]